MRAPGPSPLISDLPDIAADIFARLRARGPRVHCITNAVAQNFTGTPGKYVSLKDSIKGFKMIVNGECDALPEQAFYMVGTIEEAFEKAKTLK